MSEKVILTVDALLFAKGDSGLKILLIERKHDPFKGMYAIPGGRVDDGEKFDDTVKRELYEETNARGVKLTRFGVYGDPGRDPRGRTVAVAYWAVVDPDSLDIKAGDDAAKAKWFPVDDLPELAFDHAQIIADGIKEVEK